MFKPASLSYLFMLVLLSACTTTKNTKNFMIDESDALVLPISTLNLPITISKEGLAEQLNTVLGDTLYQDDDVDGNGLKVVALKAEHFALDITSEELIYTVPLKVLVEKKYYVTKLEAEGAISMQFKTQYAIDSTWNLSTQTTVIDYNWTGKPTLKMGGFKLPFELIANTVINGTQRYLTQTIDEEVKKAVDLQNKIQVTWRKLYQPFLASEEYKTWMILNPISMTLQPIQNTTDTISTLLQVEAQPHIILGEQPDSLPVKPLHPFNWITSEKDSFDITLVSHLPFTEITQLAGSNIIGETFVSGKRSVTVEDMELYSRGQFLIVKTKLSGSYDGWINLTGRPIIQVESNQIELINFDIELETKNILHKSAAWLFKGTFKKLVKQEIEANLSYYMDYTKEVLQEELNHVPVVDGIFMNGNLHDLKVEHLYLTEEAMKTWVSLKGDIKLEVAKKDLIKDLEEIKSK